MRKLRKVVPFHPEGYKTKHQTMTQELKDYIGEKIIF